MASPKYPLFIFEVAAALKKRYRDFNHYNLKNLLDELLFIICSNKTGEAIRIAGESPGVSAGSGRHKKTSITRRAIWIACNPKSRPSFVIRCM